jgi:hypothetical protein
MIGKVLIALTAGAIAATAFAASADAAPRKRVAVIKRTSGPPTVFVSRDETGRTRTRIIVTGRSYLDGGTEVLPGQRKFTDYVNPPNYRPTETALGPGKGFERQPLNGWFDYGYRNW